MTVRGCVWRRSCGPTRSHGLACWLAHSGCCSSWPFLRSCPCLPLTSHSAPPSPRALFACACMFACSCVSGRLLGFHEHRERAHTQIQVLVSATIKRLYSEGDASFYRFLDGIRVAEAIDMYKRAYALLEHTLQTPSFVTTTETAAAPSSGASGTAASDSSASASASSSLRTTSYATDVALQHAIQHHLQLMKGVIPQSQHAKCQRMKQCAHACTRSHAQQLPNQRTTMISLSIESGMTDCVLLFCFRCGGIVHFSVSVVQWMRGKPNGSRCCPTRRSDDWLQRHRRPPQWRRNSSRRRARRPPPPPPPRPRPSSARRRSQRRSPTPARLSECAPPLRPVRTHSRS